jgi:hypothetical protein
MIRACRHARPGDAAAVGVWRDRRGAGVELEQLAEKRRPGRPGELPRSAPANRLFQFL